MKLVYAPHARMVSVMCLLRIYVYSISPGDIGPQSSREHRLAICGAADIHGYLFDRNLYSLRDHTTRQYLSFLAPGKVL